MKWSERNRDKRETDEQTIGIEVGTSRPDWPNVIEAAPCLVAWPPNVAVQGKIIQFDWSRYWKKKVEPYLDLPLVRHSVEMGMKLYDRNWTWEDGPHAIGRGWLNGQRVVKNKLSWYQPWGRCHWISFFACAIGVLNYPDLDWQFISGKCHTVPVGSRKGEHRVVMDILNFKRMTAEKSIAHASVPDLDRNPDWERPSHSSLKTPSPQSAGWSCTKKLLVGTRACLESERLGEPQLRQTVKTCPCFDVSTELRFISDGPV